MLESIKIASPCPASWNDMKGDDRKRFCELCQLSVYNLSGMSRGEAEALVRGSSNVCVRLFRREDGTVLTQDCPVGLRAAARRVRRRLAMAAGWLLAGIGCTPRSSSSSVKLTPTGEPVQEPCVELGRIALPPRNTPPAPIVSTVSPQ